MRRKLADGFLEKVFRVSDVTLTEQPLPRLVAGHGLLVALPVPDSSQLRAVLGAALCGLRSPWRATDTPQVSVVGFAY